METADRTEVVSIQFAVLISFVISLVPCAPSDWKSDLLQRFGQLSAQFTFAISRVAEELFAASDLVFSARQRLAEGRDFGLQVRDRRFEVRDLPERAREIHILRPFEWCDDGRFPLPAVRLGRL
jgi:hypothetical protein